MCCHVGACVQVSADPDGRRLCHRSDTWTCRPQQQNNYSKCKTSSSLLQTTKLQLTYLLTPWSRVLLEKLINSQLVKKFPAFMELEVPSTCPYPEPAWSSPCHHIPFPEDPSNYPPIYVRVFQVVSFPQVSPSKLCIHIYSPTHMLHAPPNSFFSIWSPKQYSVSSTDH